MNRVTRFQQYVYDRLSEVPSGRVTTYGALAESVGCACAQAVGQALKRNPFAPRVPCHRVIRSDLSVGGFQGYSGGAAAQRKADMLLREGIRLQSGRLADRSQLHTFKRQDDSR